MTVQMYGLEKCDTCRKARKWLDRWKIQYRFIDYREQPIAADVLKSWAKQIGWDKLINRAGTTWRNLSSNRKSPASDPEWALLVKEYPALIKRPVVVFENNALSLGFSDKLFRSLFLVDESI